MKSCRRPARRDDQAHLPANALLARRGEAGGLSFAVGRPDLTRYLFNTRKNHHCFCKHCGVRAFGVGNETPIGTMYGVNLGCLDDVSDEELANAPITYVDGRNDRWQSVPAFFAHL